MTLRVFVNTLVHIFCCFTLLLITLLLTSCGQGEDDDITITNNIVAPQTTSSDLDTANTGAEDIENVPKEAEEGQFITDLTITLGTHATGEELLNTLVEEKHRVSKWSVQALNHPDFPVSAEEIEVDIIIISLLEMGFLENELVALEDILKQGEKLGLEICPPELAPQLRLQFTDQPDWSTGDRLGEFFVATEAVDLYDDDMPRIFSIIRDDAFPHKDTNIGLWLISNTIIDAADVNQRDRLFNPLDPDGDDLGGRFAFIIPGTEEAE